MVIRNACFVFLTIASVIGNSIVVQSVIMSLHTRPLNYYLVANLALAELINTLLLPVIQAYDELKSWPFGAFLCHVISPLQIATVLVITWTIVVISYHRYRTLIGPSMQTPKISHKVIVLVCLWVFSIGFAVPSAVYTVVIQSPYENTKCWCLVLFDGDTLTDYRILNKFTLARFVINFCIPVVLIVGFYSTMTVGLRRMTREVGPILLRSKAPTIILPAPSTDLHDPTFNLSPDSRHKSTRIDPVFAQEEDILRMMYVIVSVFIVCYLPYQFIFILEHFGVLTVETWNYHHITRRYLFLITCLPSALHPMCYGTISRFYAKLFSWIFLCKCFNRSRG